MSNRQWIWITSHGYDIEYCNIAGIMCTRQFNHNLGYYYYAVGDVTTALIKFNSESGLLKYLTI